MNFLILLLFFNLLFLGKAQAYIDPGSGSIILQALLGVLAAAGASISIYWNKLKNFFKKNKSEDLNKKDKNKIDKI
ncbi:hypothetical protein OAO32_02705 [Candidatus Pelagibacter sp.]|jgi:hypothetical protein|nr:hypothetical protein [Candidatus Pelagibacter sp.]